MSGDIASRWRAIVDIKAGTTPEASGTTGGVTTHYPPKPCLVLECGTATYGYAIHTEPDSMHRKALTREEKAPLIAAALAYQDTLTQAGKPSRATPKRTAA